MKKLNEDKLVFTKTNITELNDYQMRSINGGTSHANTSTLGCVKLIAIAVVSSLVCIIE